MKLYEKIARELIRYNVADNNGLVDLADTELQKIERELLPSGSGFDAGSKIIREEYKNRIKIETEFHHMNENGYYTEWTKHTITIFPCLECGMEVKVSGRNVNYIKDYIFDVFYDVLNSEYTRNATSTLKEVIA